MTTSTPDPEKSLRLLVDEMQNFEEIARYLKPLPGDIPELEGIDIYGETIPLNGVIGGDHIIYVDFRKRFDMEARIRRARERGKRNLEKRLLRSWARGGILLADVAGHRMTDYLLAAMLHQAFLLGARYEMDYYGEITTRLFENINVRFNHSSSVTKYLTMIYGEISQGGTFRFISAAHPAPKVFSNEFNRFVEVSKDRLTSFPPIGTMPPREDIDLQLGRGSLGYKEKYTANEINLMGYGDILLLYSDGISEHGGQEKPFFPQRLEEILREVKWRPAREICAFIRQDLFAWSAPQDDISLVVIKKTA
jgi:serine phosphatase RsbU (regulator of sigma subunit)